MVITMDEIKEIKGQLDLLSKGQDRILNYLESDHATNQKGLVEKVAENEKRLDQMEQKEAVRKAVYATYGFIGAFVFGFLYWLVKLIISKKIGL